ncbi:hypothetical protein [Microbacterium flavum]|uniref:Uncharacterized protein n=1 Tax=Microbacterium flavum TaxID=415216 RepID=A0ABS5XQH2_9MICO|nr:hypothetical protein [Microbacterium flavum]MBT8796696.1 hypothetical protein [Microbacterium flavum]
MWIIVCALTALGGWALWVWMFWLGHGTNWFERWWPLMMAIPFSLAALMTVRLVRRTTSSR